VPGICLINDLEQELEIWELTHYEKVISRLYKTTKNYRDPRLKKLRDYRHHRSTKCFYAAECKWIRVMTNRKFRRMLKYEIFAEEYYRFTPHDYKTYGWLTW